MATILGKLVLVAASAFTALALGGGCSSGGGGGGLACGDAGQCPLDSICQNGFCVAVGQGGSAGSANGGAAGGGSGGVSGSAGSGGLSGSGGFSGSGGSSGSGGFGASGGVGGGGAGGSAGYVCDNQATGVPTPGDCTPDDPSDTCQSCVKLYCCASFEQCLGTNPNNPCAYGAPDGSGEIYCMLALIQAGYTPSQAASACVSPGCGTISNATNALFSCLDTYCLTECALYGE